MTGYTRQSSAEINPTEPINAGPLSDEFNALETAFGAVTGHSHDGTLGNGPKINLTTSVSGILPVANGGTGASSLSGFVTLTGAQTLTNKTLTSPVINGGTITGITDLTVADGGTGASTAGDARTNLGLGTAAVMTGPSGTIVGTTDTQTLTNKTLSGGTLWGLAGSGIASGDILYGTGASAIARLAKGSDGDILTLASGVPSWTASAGACSFVESITASGAAAIIFDAGFTSDATEYIFNLDNIGPNNDNTALTMELSTDGGSSWSSVGCNVTLISSTSSASTVSGASGPALITLTSNLRNQSNDTVVGKISLIPGSQRNNVSGKYFGRNYSPLVDTAFDLNASVLGSSPYRVNAVRFKAASGNITGTIHMYKLNS